MYIFPTYHAATRQPFAALLRAPNGYVVFGLAWLWVRFWWLGLAKGLVAWLTKPFGAVVLLQQA
jgi:hypothetical protein